MQVAVRCTVAALLAVLILVPAAGADWLVSREGEEIETRGGWEVRDRLVVFHLPSGELASLRVDDVDLEASEALTAEKRRAAEQETEEGSGDEAADEPEREAVVSWTDADFSRRRRPEAVSSGEGSDGEPERTTPEGAAPAEPVVVASWEQVDTGKGYVGLTGIVENNGETLATGVSVTAALIDGEGVKVGEAQAQLSSSSLPPDGRARFRATFPQVFNFATARFTVDSQGFDVVSPDATRIEEAGEDEGGGESGEGPEQEGEEGG